MLQNVTFRANQGLATTAARQQAANVAVLNGANAALLDVDFDLTSKTLDLVNTNGSVFADNPGDLRVFQDAGTTAVQDISQLPRGVPFLSAEDAELRGIQQVRLSGRSGRPDVFESRPTGAGGPPSSASLAPHLAALVSVHPQMYNIARSCVCTAHGRAWGDCAAWVVLLGTQQLVMESSHASEQSGPCRSCRLRWRAARCPPLPP